MYYSKLVQYKKVNEEDKRDDYRRRYLQIKLFVITTLSYKNLVVLMGLDNVAK